MCVLDSRGKSSSSEAFSDWVEERRQGGLDVCFVIGGAFGIELPDANHMLSFGPMTLPQYDGLPGTYGRGNGAGED